MTSLEDIYHNKTDEEIFEAAACLHEYTEEVKRIILLEAKHRGLNVALLVDAANQMQSSPTSAGVVPHCDYCGTRIIFGGRRDGNKRFCNEECRDKGILLAVSQSMPDSTVNEQLWKLHQSHCPQCGGPGPVDVHISYRVWSSIVLTRWSNRPVISCRSCGTRAKLGDMLFSIVLGWWGAWGLIITPMQIFRNLYGMIRQGDDSRPSAQLEKIVRLHLAAEFVAAPSNKPIQ